MLALVLAAIYPFVCYVFENVTRSVIGQIHAITRVRRAAPRRAPVPSSQVRSTFGPARPRAHIHTHGIPSIENGIPSVCALRSSRLSDKWSRDTILQRELIAPGVPLPSPCIFRSLMLRVHIHEEYRVRVYRSPYIPPSCILLQRSAAR